MVLAQKADPAGQDRHQGMLFGNIKGEQLLIGGFDGDHFDVGDHVILRMAVESQLVGFRTDVIHKIETPLMYAVAFPVAVEAINLRKADRIHAFFPAHLYVEKHGGDVYELSPRVMDISAGGCCFRSKTKLPPQSEVKISFSLPGERHIQSASAVVLYSTRIAGVFNIRVRFSQEAKNIPIIQEITNWVNDSLTFGVEEG